MILLLLVSLFALLELSNSSVSRSNNEFSFDMLKALPFKNGNQFFSPLSISAAIAMTSLGARHDTLREIKDTFHFNEAEKSSSDEMVVHKFFQSVLEKYGEENEDYCLKLANHLFVKEDCGILPEFLEHAKKYYNSSADIVDFTSGKAEDLINKWVKENTDGKIKKIFPPHSFTTDTLLALVNVIYFKGEWKNKFIKERTKMLPFHVNSFATKNVSMMSTTGYFLYTEDTELNVKMIQMPYVDGDLNMVVILPEQGALPKLISELNANKLHSLIMNANPMKIHLKFPKFELQKKYFLKHYLKKLGLNDIFTNRADLSGITRKASELSSVVHKAILDVNEKGTEAAAASGYAIRANSMFAFRTANFIVDRPFFFAIIDTRFDNLILFSGSVIRP